MKKIILILLIAFTSTMCKNADKQQEKENSQKEVAIEPKEKLQTVAEFQKRPGNVAIDKNERIFSTMHPLAQNAKFQLIEVIGKNKVEPFPSLDYQKNGREASKEKIDSPLGIRIDKNNVLWIVDMGQNLGTTRIWGFDIATKKEVFRYDLPQKLAPKGSFIQDLAIDEENGWIYLADIANPGILAVDMENKTTRRFSNEVMQSEDIDIVINGTVVNFGGGPARVGVNPITLSDDRNTLFFGSMNGTKWYSLSAELFRKEKGDSEIAESIKTVGDKPLSDGAATDASGNHFFTNLSENGVDVLTTSGQLEPVIRDASIDWSDNVAVGTDGSIYVVINQLYKTTAFTGNDDTGEPPYYIKRILR